MYHVKFHYVAILILKACELHCEHQKMVVQNQVFQNNLLKGTVLMIEVNFQ